MNYVHVGKISFINNSPIYYALERGIVSAPFEITEDIPSRLNNLLCHGGLDIAPISSLEYGRRCGDYLLLPGLSISSYGPVGSVVLFSKIPIDKLNGHPIMVTSASTTSPMLLRVALEEVYGVSPRYIVGEIHRTEIKEDVIAGLTIGDLALSLRDNEAEFPYRLDLGEVWTRLTKYPFVFAVWAVRKSFYVRHPDVVNSVHKALLDSKAWGLNHLDEISQSIHSRVSLSPAQCRSYLEGLNFDFEETHQKALLLFFKQLSQRGILHSPVTLEYIAEI